jgi:hypothetical protein
LRAQWRSSQHEACCSTHARLCLAGGPPGRKSRLPRQHDIIFAHAISIGSAASLYGTWRIIIDGQDPDNFSLDDREQLVVDFGRCLARPGGWVPGDLYARLSSEFTDEQIVALTAFGALMLATNVFNNALEVDLDDYLEPYVKAATAHPSIPQGERVEGPS